MRTSILCVSCLLSFSLLVGCGPQGASGGADAATPVPEADAGQVVEPVDAGEVDAGLPAVDAGAVDAGEVDAGQVDAGAPDAGCVCGLPRYCDASERCVSDTLPPRITVTAAAGATTATLRVSGTATDPETGVSAVEVRLGAAGAVTVPLVNGAYDAQLPVPAGARYEFRVEVKARDGAGNEATAQTIFDTLAPALSITPNQPGACTSSGCTGAVIDAATTSFTVTADVVESVALATNNPVQVRVSALGGAVVVPWTDLTASGSGTWSWTWTGLPNLDFTQLQVEVSATDAAGNRATASVGLLFDRVRPALSFSPSQDAACTPAGCTGTVVNLATTSLDFLGVTSPDATISLRVLDGASVALAPVAVPVSSGSFTYSWSGFPSVDGRFYAVELTATDALLNATSRQVVVLVDRVLPTLLINSPRQGNLVGSAQVQVNASASDGHGVRVVEAGPSASGPFVAGAQDTNGDYLAPADVPVVDAVEQTLFVRAIDLVGNTRTATTRYTADRVAPQLTLSGVDCDCSGPVCTGSVANRASASLAYSGTASDGSPVTIAKTVLSGTQTIASSSDPLSGTAWSWSWTSLPANVNGAEYQLRVVATDAAGNSSAALVRRTWLDNVAPTLSIPVDGATTVAVSDVLVTASEPMNVTSVRNAVNFTPAVTMTGFGSGDGRSFVFNPPALQTYTRYGVWVGIAQDKAGNPSAAAASGAFTTRASVFPNPRTVLSPPTDGAAYRLPSVVVDADGRATLAYSRDTGSVVETVIRHDVGTGAVAVLTPYPGHTVVTPTSLRLTGATRQADGRLVTTSELGFVMTDGSNSSLAFGTITSTPGSGTEVNAVSHPTTIGPTRTTPRTDLSSMRPALEQVQGYSQFTGQYFTVRNIVAPNVGATAVSAWSDSGGWSASTPSSLTNFQYGEGRATVEAPTATGPYRVRFFDLGQKSEVFSGNLIRSATAPPTLKSADAFGMNALTASYVAWTTETTLSVACSASPFAATPVWRATVTNLPARTVANSPLSSAMTSSLVVVAGEYGGNVVVFSTPQQASCGAAPVLTQVGVITGAKEPGVHIDAAGRIWVATITSSGGIQLNQF